MLAKRSAAGIANRVLAPCSFAFSTPVPIKEKGNAMKASICRYCKEEIKADALICKHCHQRLDWSREEMLMSAVSEGMRVAVVDVVSAPSGSACEAFCHARAGSGAPLNECLDSCKATEAVRILAERMQRELVFTFHDVIWGGGDIDPLPLERSVRQAFSQPREP